MAMIGVGLLGRLLAAGTSTVPVFTMLHILQALGSTQVIVTLAVIGFGLLLFSPGGAIGLVAAGGARIIIIIVDAAESIVAASPARPSSQPPPP
jgi:hypothetical protein